MSEYGMIFDTKTIKRQLKDANRDYTGRKTWESLYSAVDLSKQQQLSSLQYDYSKQISDAYATAYETNVGIASSNLGQGYKDAAIADTNAALEEAYNTYRLNYLQGVSEVESTASEMDAKIDYALTEQADYMKQFAKAPYEYLQYLFDTYAEGDDEDNIFLNNELWKRYANVDDETGELSLKSWDEIASTGSFDEHTDESGNVVKEWTGLFDDSGNLTVKGADFYDQMMNYFDSVKPGQGLGFGQWLATNKEDLYNWSTSYNPYDYTVGDGTNVGSFRTMVGLTSTDEEYSFIERFGGLTKNEVDTMYSNFTTTLENLDAKLAKSSGTDSKSIVKNFKNVTDEIRVLAEDLGISDDIEKEIGMSFDDLATYLAENAKAAKSNGDLWWEGVKLSALETGVGAGVGTKYGGWKGAIIGGITGLITGTASAIAVTESNKKDNKAIAKASRNAYTDLVNTLVNYSYSKRRQSQGDWYKLNK